MSDFFRFPHTPHLAWLAHGTPRDDKVLSNTEVETMLSAPVVVEEKLDGANIGISVDEHGRLLVQNRGQYLERPFSGQFARLETWLDRHEDALFDALGSRLIAFGEWCAARHSINYEQLPDWWLLFDVYDKQKQKFWSTKRRNALANMIGVAYVPQLFFGDVSLASLTHQLIDAKSAYSDGPLEGIVIRREDSDWLLQRAKLVRADFTQSIEQHWRSQALTWNNLNPAKYHSG